MKLKYSAFEQEVRKLEVSLLFWHSGLWKLSAALVCWYQYFGGTYCYHLHV